MINKAIESNSEFKSANVNVDGTITCYGTQKERGNWAEWDDTEIAVVKALLALVASKYGYEGGDIEAVETELDAKIAELKIVAEPEELVKEVIK